jgi:hypothetical protein
MTTAVQNLSMRAAEPTQDGPPEGRDPSSGKFLRGNKGGIGNPLARRASALRATLFKTVTPQDLEQVAKAILKKAKDGNLPACTLLLRYLLGPGESIDLVRMVAKLENQLATISVKGVRL